VVTSFNEGSLLIIAITISETTPHNKTAAVCAVHVTQPNEIPALPVMPYKPSIRLIKIGYNPNPPGVSENATPEKNKQTPAAAKLNPEVSGNMKNAK
jgi:hypothetical protein